MNIKIEIIKTKKIEFERWFGDLFLRPGPGHIEQNMARALMKLAKFDLTASASILPSTR